MKLGWQMTNKTPLTDDAIVMWAARSFWEEKHAVLLAMGLEPVNGNAEYYIEEDDPERYVLGNRRQELFEILDSALATGDIEGHLITDPDSGSQYLRPYPLSTIEHLVSKGVPVDDRLRIAVLKANNKWTPLDTVSSDTTCKPATVPVSDIVKNDPIVAPVPDAQAEHLYCFQKIGKSWNIQFGEVKLLGLRHYTGMDYIRTLLQQPYVDVDVFDLQVIMNPEINTKMPKRTVGDYYKEDDDSMPHSNNSEIRDEGDDSDPYAYGKKNFTREQRKRIAILKQELPELKVDLEKALLCNDIAEQTRLTPLVNILEDELCDILQFRNDDPEIDSNRKKVRKNIEDARKYIFSEEKSRGYDDTPVYNYLKKYIETGFYCQYKPPSDDPIPWVF